MRDTTLSDGESVGEQKIRVMPRRPSSLKDLELNIEDKLSKYQWKRAEICSATTVC